MFTYVYFMDLSVELRIPAFVLGARGLAPQHFEHSKIAFHNFAATGSIFNALMMSRPGMDVGVLVRSISGSWVEGNERKSVQEEIAN